jgi:hypothetical protein
VSTAAVSITPEEAVKALQSEWDELVQQLNAAFGQFAAALLDAFSEIRAAIDDVSEHPQVKIARLFPGLHTTVAHCPGHVTIRGERRGCRHAPGSTLSYVMVHLNDDHHWTREHIADWLESYSKEAGLDLSVAL